MPTDSLLLFDTTSPIFAWVVLPLLIFVARTLDVSLSTLRIVSIAQGRTTMAAVVGFFESLLWLAVIGQALGHLGNPLCVMAYAGGFAMGNVMGLRLEARLAMGQRLVRLILPASDLGDLVEELRADGHGVTVVDGEGQRGPVKILFTIVGRKALPAMIESIRERHPKAFITVEDVRQATEGVFLAPLRRGGPRRWGWRLGK